MTTDMHAAFSFHKTPYTREIETQEMMPMPHLDEPCSAIVELLHRRMCAAIIAPAGTGKSCLLRALRDRLAEARYRVHYIKVTDLGKRDFCRELATAIGVRPAGSYPMLVRRIQEDFVGRGVSDGVRSVLMIDEAHDIRPEVLGILRILTNFEWDSKLVLSIVLAGQPRLETMLNKAPLEDVAQRIAYYARLRLLSRDETTGYLTHRATIAGAPSLPFDKGAVEAIFEMSRGNMRAIDRLALGALDETARRGARAASSSDVAIARKNLWA